MRKLILTILFLIPFLAGCQRSSDVLDHLEPGSQVTVTKHDGQAVTGRLTETRSDAIVLQPANGSPTAVARKDIATVTISAVRPNANAASTPAAPGASPAAPPPQPAPPEEPRPGEPLPNSAAAPSSGGRASVDALPSPPQWREVVVPAGTQMAIRLDDTVASDSSRPEEAVRATLIEDLVVHGVTAIPEGSAVGGTVTQAKRSGKVKGVAELAIRFDSVTPKGTESRYRVRTGIVTRKAATTHRKDALQIGAPAAGGAILGGLLGGKKGALIGTTVGGGAGTAVVLSTRGKEVRLPRGTHLVIKLMEPVTVRVPA
jgi:hypothetical protein